MPSPAKELNLGQSRTNPVSSRLEAFNLGLPDNKTNALTTQPHRLANIIYIIGDSIRLYVEFYGVYSI